ncbi:MAG: hypothetical protein ACRDRK_12560 [Pseudonocardia sp.]
MELPVRRGVGVAVRTMARVHWGRSATTDGKFPPIHVDDAGARSLGFTPRGVEEGLKLTAEWIGRM